MKSYTIVTTSGKTIIGRANQHSFSDGILKLTATFGESIFTDIECFTCEDLPESNEEKIARLENEVKELTFELDHKNKLVTQVGEELKNLRNILVCAKFGNRKQTIKEAKRRVKDVIWEVC
jgi:peptidoglycan hydrolase CwlO-like protein